MRKLIMVAVFMLAPAVAHAWEAASIYDPKRGRYISTEQFKKDYGVKDVCQSASCYDSHSGRFISDDDWNKRQSERNK